jgi:hypothetical protein
MRGKTLSNAIADLLSKEIFFACDYCGGRHSRQEKIPPAVQARFPLPYEKLGGCP